MLIVFEHFHLDLVSWAFVFWEYSSLLSLQNLNNPQFSHLNQVQVWFFFQIKKLQTHGLVPHICPSDLLNLCLCDCGIVYSMSLSHQNFTRCVAFYLFYMASFAFHCDAITIWSAAKHCNIMSANWYFSIGISLFQLRLKVKIIFLRHCPKFSMLCPLVPLQVHCLGCFIIAIIASKKTSSMFSLLMSVENGHAAKSHFTFFTPVHIIGIAALITLFSLCLRILMLTQHLPLFSVDVIQ